jgi:hypothetical protein
MNKTATLLLTLTVFVGYSQSLTLKWKTDASLPVPESVLYDPSTQTIFVSCIDGKGGDRDGKGGIARVSTEGTVLDPEWVGGLNAPKGMGLSGKYLYVADLSQVVMIEQATGQIVDRINPEGAAYLNDITVDKAGAVYASDSETGKIFRIVGNQASLYFQSDSFERINGLLALKKELYIVDFATGINYKLTHHKRELVPFSRTGQGADGIVELGKGQFLVSSWHGEIYYVAPNGESKKILDTQEEKLNAADIWFDAKSNTLYVPTFMDNSVMAYTFSK